MTDDTEKSSSQYILIDTLRCMTTLPERLHAILSEMEGPDHGKQVRLATLAECKRATITHYLKNPGSEIGYEYAKNIADRLGYNVDWVITGRGDPKNKEQQTAPISLTYVDQDESVLLTMYRESTKEGREYIRESAKLTEKTPRINISSSHKP